MKNVLISDVMTRDPITTSPETNLLECAKLMVKKRVGSLLLVEKKHLVGIISRKDEKYNVLWEKWHHKRISKKIKCRAIFSEKGE